MTRARWVARMQLDPCAFNRLLAGIGQDVLWRRSYLCPCVNPHSGASKPNCPRCSGKGRFWDPPVASRVGVPSTRVQREWAQFGRYESGDMVLSIPSDQPIYEMGEFDRVTALNSSDVFQLPMVRGQNDLVRFPVLSITRVFWLAQNGEVVEGALPEVAPNGALSWVMGGPPPGTQYTVCGLRYAEYYCYMELPSDRGEHGGALLPRKVALRKFDLFGR